MERKFTDTLILGASFYGMSLLINSKSSSVLIERGCRVGYEFSASMHKSIYNQKPKNKIGNIFYDSLKKDGFIDKDGFMDSVPSAYMLSELAKIKSNSIMFMTEIINISKKDEGYCVNAFNSNGNIQIIAKRIIDTTSEGVTVNHFSNEQAEKFINIISVNKDEKLKSYYDPFKERYICSFKAEKNEEISATRKRLIKYLKYNSNNKTIYIADEFDYCIPRIQKEIDDNYYWIPSISFDNPIEAVDNGGYDIKINEPEYDIAVVGLGTAGTVALMKSAKRGLKVIGIERLSQMGGTGTAGGISHYYYGLRGGEYEEIDNKADKLRDEICDGCTAARTDLRAYTFEQEATEVGAKIVFNSVVTSVDVENKCVQGLTYVKNGRKHKIKTKVVIDATGDSQICKMAGCELQKGRKSDNQMQTYANVLMVMSDNNVYGINKDAGYVEQSENESISKEIINSSAFLYNICKEYKDRLKYISNTMLLGCREGERIIGEKNITFKECICGYEFPDTAFYAFSNIDSHSKDIAFEDEEIKDWYIGAGLWGVGIKCSIPVGAMIPKGFNGILAAGRCIATEHNVAGCIRMMSDMKRCGEAAGEIACISIEDNTELKNINYDKLAQRLKQSGCLKKPSGSKFANRIKGANNSEDFEWITDIEVIKDGLLSDSPGIAIWSAKLMGKETENELEKWIEDKDCNLRCHSAIALGMMKNKKSLPILRTMAKERDIFIPKSSIKFTYARGVTAIYLLGKLHDVQSIDLLLDIVISGGAFEEAAFVPDELHQSVSDMKFMFISNAVASLFEIGNAVTEKRGYIINKLTEKLCNNTFDIKICLKDNPYIEYSMSDLLGRQLELYTNQGGKMNENKNQ